MLRKPLREGNAARDHDRLYKSGASCLSVTAPTTYSFFSLGAAVPASQFVQLTTTAPNGTGAFPIKYLQSADGFQARRSCTTPPITSIATRSRPATVRRPQGAHQAPRTRAANTATLHARNRDVLDHGIPAQPYASVPSMSAADLPMYSTPGATVAASPQYDWNYSVSPPVCTAETAAVGETFYATGAPFTFGAFTRAPDTTSGLRMENIHDVNGATRVREFTIYDTMLHSECFTQQLPDGSYECVPTSSGVVASFFTDAGCSAKVDLTSSREDRRPARRRRCRRSSSKTSQSRPVNAKKRLKFIRSAPHSRGRSFWGRLGTVRVQPGHVVPVVHRVPGRRGRPANQPRDGDP